jgi:hypothetical protein
MRCTRVPTGWEETMTEVEEAQQHRQEADQRPDDDIVGVLLRQHADILESVDRVKNAGDASRAADWDALVTLLTAHEKAEQAVVRPVTQQTAGVEEANARNAEESEAERAIAELAALGADSADFGARFAGFATSVHDHAEREEHEEFPTLDRLSADDRVALGRDFLAAFGRPQQA